MYLEFHQSNNILSDNISHSKSPSCITEANYSACKPVVDLPVVDLPVVDLPAVDLPAVDLPVVDLPVVDLPQELKFNLFEGELSYL